MAQAYRDGQASEQLVGVLHQPLLLLQKDEQ